MSSETMGWAATYGGVKHDAVYSIQQTPDGDYIVAGCTDSSGAGLADGWVLKLRLDGSVEWQKTYGGDLGDMFYSIQQTRDGGYIVAGWTESFGSGGRDFWVLKLRPDGSVEWQKTYGGENHEESRSIYETSDGSYIVAGWTESFGTGQTDAWILKLGSDGIVEWQKSYGGVNDDEAYSIKQASDGGYIVAGRTNSFGVRQAEGWVLKLEASGIVKWQKTYGGNDWEEILSIQQTTDGGYIVAGYRKSLSVKQTEGLVLKLRSDGTVEWQKTYGGEQHDMACSIQQTSDGGYIVAGWTDSFGVNKADGWVLKLRADGSVEWQKTYGGSDNEGTDCIQQTSDGGYIVSGVTWSFGRRVDEIWLLKLRPNGSVNPSCDFIRDTSILGEDVNAIILDASAGVMDSSAIPLDSSATIRATEVSAHLLCHPDEIKRSP